MPPEDEEESEPEYLNEAKDEAPVRTDTSSTEEAGSWLSGGPRAEEEASEAVDAVLM